MTALTPLLLVLLMAFFDHRVTALQQRYCSSQNTGSDFSPVWNEWQSNGACFDTCKAAYAFAVVQNQLCWCSNYIPAEQLSISQCGKVCPGYGTEQCGNIDTGLFGYIALSISPSGTASTSIRQSSTSSTLATTTAPPPSSSTTQSSSLPATTTSIEASPSPAPTPTESPSTSFPQLDTSSYLATSQQSSISSVSPVPSSSLSSSATATGVPSPVVSTQIVTLAGSVVTQTVTSTPRTTVTAGSAVDQPEATTAAPVGAIVGGVIGGVALLAAIALIAFLIWRRKRNNGSVSSINRNASVLSRSGLISSPRTGDAEKSGDEGAFGSQRHSGLYNDQFAPVAGSVGSDRSGPLQRRNSRPLVYDQRLNPAALMENWEANGSRSSINTMQDQRDYSRPLGITNPDTHPDN